MTRGRLYAGTSGFAYPSWAPRFYPPGLKNREVLPAYAARLSAVELNNTFYRRPSRPVVEQWLAATPEDFRFCPKAQRGSSWRAWSEDDPTESLAWLTNALGAFGERLGCVLMSAPGTLERDDEALQRVLRGWPSDMPLALELPHASWDDDAVHDLLRTHGKTLVTSDWDDRPEPDLRRTGPFVYLRLRRAAYSEADVERWALRLEPFLADGMDAFVFFRHDDDGTSAIHAERLLSRSQSVIGA